MRRKKIILDANLIIAAYWNKGSSSARIIRGCIEGLYQMYYTDRTKNEAFRILENIKAGGRYKKKIQGLFERATKPRRHLEALYLIKEDPHDDKYLEAALASGAGYIITSDKHLLRLGSFRRIKILKPSDFIRTMVTGQQTGEIPELSLRANFR